MSRNQFDISDRVGSTVSGQYASSLEDVETKVVMIGVGGASSSGKTTLTKQLQKILNNCVIIHQDGFAPPDVPIHPTYHVQDWDTAPGAIDWPRFASFLQAVKKTGQIPEGHKSLDHMNQQKEVASSSEVISLQKKALVEWERQWIQAGSKKGKRRKLGWVIVDGFLLYWNKDAVDTLDVRFLLRAPRDVLKQRREGRGYYIEAQSAADQASMWEDPPFYFDNIVYPAYVDAHKGLFEGGDVERGKLHVNGDAPQTAENASSQGTTVQGLILIEANTMSVDELTTTACQALLDHVRQIVDDGL